MLVHSNAHRGGHAKQTQAQNITITLLNRMRAPHTVRARTCVSNLYASAPVLTTISAHNRAVSPRARAASGPHYHGSRARSAYKYPRKRAHTHTGTHMRARTVYEQSHTTNCAFDK